MKELPSIQPASFCSIKDPSHLDFGLEEDVLAPEEQEIPVEIVDADKERKKASNDLWSFQLKQDQFMGKVTNFLITCVVSDRWLISTRRKILRLGIT